MIGATTALIAIAMICAVTLAFMPAPHATNERTKMSDWLTECQAVKFTEQQCRFFRDGVKWREHLDDAGDSQ